MNMPRKQRVPEYLKGWTIKFDERDGGIHQCSKDRSIDDDTFLEACVNRLKIGGLEPKWYYEYRVRLYRHGKQYCSIGQVVRSRKSAVKDCEYEVSELLELAVDLAAYSVRMGLVACAAEVERVFREAGDEVRYHIQSAFHMKAETQEIQHEHAGTQRESITDCGVDYT